MITEQTVSRYGIVALIIMVTLLVLVVFDLVPQSMYVPFFIIATAAFVIRIVLRMLLARQKRSHDSDEEPGS